MKQLKPEVLAKWRSIQEQTDNELRFSPEEYEQEESYNLACFLEVIIPEAFRAGVNKMAHLDPSIQFTKEEPKQMTLSQFLNQVIETQDCHTNR